MRDLASLRSRLALLLTLCGTLLALPGLAAGTQVKVTADTFVIDQATNKATFTGAVVITRGSMTMWADKAVVNYGKGGEGDIDGLDATGNVRIKTTGQEATGNRAVFTPDNSTVRLTGNVRVTNATGTMNGPELTINLASNSSVFKGSEEGRVTGVFTPQ
jgi:lipopolysaccharide export system protein LptA